MHLDNPREAGTTRLPAINGSGHPIPDHSPFDTTQGQRVNYVERRTAVNNKDELLILWLQSLNLLLTSS